MRIKLEKEAVHTQQCGDLTVRRRADPTVRLAAAFRRGRASTVRRWTTSEGSVGDWAAAATGLQLLQGCGCYTAPAATVLRLLHDEEEEKCRLLHDEEEEEEKQINSWFSFFK